MGYEEHKAEKMKTYTDHFSKTYSKEILDYAEKAFWDYIFTRQLNEQQYGYCTACKMEYKTEGLRHKDHGKCPGCNKTVIVQSAALGRSKMINQVYFIYYEKSVIDPDVIVARGIHAAEDFTGTDYKHVKPRLCDRTLYIFKIGESVMLKRSTYYCLSSCMSYPIGNFTDFEKSATIYSELNPWAVQHYSRGWACFSRDSIANAVKGTPFQYSMWEEYDDEPMVKFFELYSKYPKAVEYLSKLGFERLVDAKLTGTNTYGAVNWRGKTIFEILRLNRLELKQLRVSNIIKKPLYVKLYQINKKDKHGLGMYELLEVESAFGCNQLKDINIITKHTSLKKAFNYIKDQYASCKARDGKCHFQGMHDTLGNYRDYIKDCMTLEMDMTKEQVLFPKNLYNAHQNTISQAKIKANEHLNQAILKRYETLYHKYYFEYQGFIIRPAKTADELIHEGQALNHCVGTYANSHAKGEIGIFFIRKISKPNKPYYTTEIRQDRIIQTRGKNNCSPNKDVEAFLQAFTEEKLVQKKPEERPRIMVPA